MINVFFNNFKVESIFQKRLIIDLICFQTWTLTKKKKGLQKKKQKKGVYPCKCVWAAIVHSLCQHFTRRKELVYRPSTNFSFFEILAECKHFVILKNRTKRFIYRLLKCENVKVRNWAKRGIQNCFIGKKRRLRKEILNIFVGVLVWKKWSEISNDFFSSIRI